MGEGRAEEAAAEAEAADEDEAAAAGAAAAAAVAVAVVELFFFLLLMLLCACPLHAIESAQTTGTVESMRAAGIAPLVRSGRVAHAAVSAERRAWLGTVVARRASRSLEDQGGARAQGQDGGSWVQALHIQPKLQTSQPG